MKKSEIIKVHICKTEKSMGRPSFRNGLIQTLNQHCEHLVSFHCSFLPSTVSSEPSSSWGGLMLYFLPGVTSKKHISTPVVPTCALLCIIGSHWITRSSLNQDVWYFECPGWVKSSLLQLTDNSPHCIQMEVQLTVAPQTEIGYWVAQLVKSRIRVFPSYLLQHALVCEYDLCKQVALEMGKSSQCEVVK